MSSSKKSRVFNQGVLALVFTVSFAIYFAPELSVALQLAPIALFAGLVAWKAFWSDSLVASLAGFFETDSLAYVIFLSVLMMGASLESSFEQSFQFALLLSVCLVLARIYMTLVPLEEVLGAFYWSAVVSLVIFLPLSFGMLIRSATTFERLWVFNFHPNLLGLQLAGYVCVMVWKFVTSGWFLKAVSGMIGSVCIVIMFLASSRGAVVGVGVGCAFVAGVVLVRASKQSRKRTLKLTGLIAFVLATSVLLIGNLEPIQESYVVVDKLLELSNPGRGLDSGMTGRVDIWQEVVRAISDGSWLFGHGVRSSDAVYSYDPKIDNSYLVILYDMGVTPLILITWRFVSVLGRTTRNCVSAIDQDQRRLYLACSMFVIVLLVTSIVERSLFAVGNPFSLLAFLFFATPNRCFERIGISNGAILSREL